jgi:hypothetical protein
LLFILISTVTYLAGQALLSVAGLMVGFGTFATLVNQTRAGGGAGPAVVAGGGGMIALIVLGLILWLVCEGLWITGIAFCLGTPPRRGARPLAMTVLIMRSIAAALSIPGLVILLANRGEIDPASGSTAAQNGFNMISGILGIASFIVFLCFLRAVAFLMKSPRLGETCLYLLITSILASVIGCGAVFIGTIVLGVSVGLSAAAKGGAGPGPGLGGGLAFLFGCGAILFLIWLGLAIWYVVTIVRIRGRVGDYLARA